MGAPHLNFSPIPLNTISKSNQLKLKAVQNKVLRWINSDTPPYQTAMKTLHDIYELQPLNIRHYTNKDTESGKTFEYTSHMMLKNN